MPASQDVRVNQSSDDAEEISGSPIDLTSSDLELVTETAVQSVGIRFNGLNVPQGAVVTSAYIQFQVDETSSDATSLVIQAEASDNAVTFASGSNNVQNRALTSASVLWSPGPWVNPGEAAEAQQTPDIGTIIQEVVNRPGWEIGNSLVIIINGTGVRIAESVDGDPNGAPLLHVEYELTDQQAPVVDAGPDQEVTLPAGITLNASISDDGLPSPPGSITALWTQQGGPGTVSFGNAASANTSASFSVAGTYVLRLTANDSERVAFDEVAVVVNPAPAPPVFTSFAPASAQVAMIVTLSGSNLSAVDAVEFNGIAAQFWADGDSTIYATVPAGGAGGLITVSNPWGSATSGSAFSLLTSPPVLVGAGDITNCSGDEEQVAQLLDVIPGSVFTLGDNAYNGAGASMFNNCYGSTWGRHKDRTRPSVGNTDYGTVGAAGYFNYFGAAAGEPSKGYYSYDVANWHVVTLNSQCDEAGGCERDSAQGIWLREDLAKNPQACTVAIWHHARYSSAHGSDGRLIDFWKILYDAGVELVLNGHDHNYERFELQDPYGNVDPMGIRQIIAGTGGIYLDPLIEIAPNSLVHNDDSHGVLKLTLNSNSYDWEFVPIAGDLFTDSGSGACRLVNQPPVIIAGPDQQVSWPDDALLQGVSLDDGYPNPPGSYVTDWSQVSGPGIATFADGSQPETSVSFSELGRYTLRLTGDDGALVSTDDVEVIVTEPGVDVFDAQFRVSAGNDDAEESVGTSVVYMDSGDLELIHDTDSQRSDQIVGMRFNGVDIPPDATIWNAYIQFQVDEVTVDPAQLVVAAEAADNSSVYTTAAGDLSTRSVTNASVSWAPPPWTEVGLVGEEQRTPDLSEIIQEVIDRPGWSSGNSLSILVTGSGQRTAESYEGNSSAAPLLVVEYAKGLNAVPDISITAPANGASVVEGTALTFMSTAQDDEDGDLSLGVNWNSDLDGDFGSGSAVNAVLSVGVHTITASVTDTGGKVATEQITVTVTPNLAPAVSISAPADGTSVEEGTELGFVATAPDDIDGDLSPGLSWNSDLDGDFGTGGTVNHTLSVGVHTITASVTDSAGLPGSAQISVTVTEPPNEAPQVMVITPLDGTSVVEGTPLTFIATADDDVDGSIDAAINWNSSIEGDFGTGGTVDVTLSVGVHVITASVTDSGGLPGSVQITVTVTEQPNVAPEVFITGPADGTSVTEGTSLTFVATAPDDKDGDIAAQINWNSSLDGDFGTGGTVNHTLSVGVHTITASVTDSGGLPGSQQITVTVTANVAPQVLVTSPADGSSVVEGTALTFTATASDGEDGDIAAQINWNSNLDGDFGTGGTVNHTLSVGVHTITASVTDSGGLPGSQQITVTVTAAPANLPPELVFTAPADGASITEGTELTFTATATDGEDGDLAAQINWNSTLDGDFGTGGTVNHTLSVGVHTITASVTDSGGLPASQQITVTVTANAAPQVLVTSPADGTREAEGDQVTFTGTATDAEDGDISIGLTWTSSRDGLLGNGASVVTTLSRGVHVITASITDSGGLAASEFINLTITAPLLPVNVDVLPGDAANIIYPNQAGNLPVAVLSSADFDATRVNPSSLRLGPGQAMTNGNVQITDVDGQFGNDTVVEFPVEDSGILCNDIEVTLNGELWSGRPVSGVDVIDASQCEEGGCHAY
ncbi:MAG: metallophosphoesterase [Gammaproteobacteria bacterium]